MSTEIGTGSSAGTVAGMSMEDNSVIVETFMEEALDLLQKWESEVLSLEQSERKNDYTELLRVAHNIKGSSKMLGLEQFGGFVHQLEDLINLVNSNQVALNQDIVDFFLLAHSTMLAWVGKLAKNINYAPKELNELLKAMKMLEKPGGSTSSTNSASTASSTSNAILKHQTVATEVEVAKEVVVESGNIQVRIEDDLIIHNMEKISQSYAFLQQGSYSLQICGKKIDTAGVQFLMALKQEFKEKLSISISAVEIVAVLDLLGVKEKIL
ncbi:MAG: Hpt domain-containing protein [Oligoflexia bacterium]|nr:Hpt domain-containing protein [Oligoflexia bacterium]MBF0364342.1 Hpt domain-containing protein [Oligoflexia bacterium]